MKELLDGAGLTVREAGRLAGIPSDTLNGIVLGYTPLYPENALRIAALTGASADRLMSVQKRRSMAVAKADRRIRAALREIRRRVSEREEALP